MTEQAPPQEPSQPLADDGTRPGRSSRLPGRPLWWAIGGIIAAGAVIIALILVFAGGGGRDLTVRFALIDIEDGVSCSGGTGGYSDVGPGMAVVVRNNDSQVIGTGSLGSGGKGLRGQACEWTAVVEDVPSGEDYYSVTVGRRGEQVYTGEELEEAEWDVFLSLGGA